MGAERAGRVVRLLVDEGRVVRKGELLAEIESDALRAALREAQAQVAGGGGGSAPGRADAAPPRGPGPREDRWPRTTSTRPSRDLEIARARVDTARAAVARDEAQLRETRIVAPIAGTVTARHVQPGEMLEVGRTRRHPGRPHAACASRRKRTRPTPPPWPWARRCRSAPTASRAGRGTGRVEEIPDSVTLRRLKPQDPGRPTDTRVLAVKVAFAEPTPLKLGTTVELKIAATPGR